MGILAGDLLNGACFRGLRTAVLGRIPALLSSDEFRVERRAQGSGQALWRVAGRLLRKWSCGRLWLCEEQGQLLSSATFLRCGAHALLGSLLGSLAVRAQWQGCEAAGPAACCQRVSSATLAAMYPMIRRVTALASTGRL